MPVIVLNRYLGLKIANSGRVTCFCDSFWIFLFSVQHSGSFTYIRIQTTASAGSTPRISMPRHP